MPPENPKSRKSPQPSPQGAESKGGGLLQQFRELKKKLGQIRYVKMLEDRVGKQWLAYLKKGGLKPDEVLKNADKIKGFSEGVRIIKQAAEKAPWSALKYADRYVKEPWGKEVIKLAAEKVPGSALEYADRYVKEPWGKEVIKQAAEKAPGYALEYADRYVKEPWGKEVIKQAAELAAEKDPRSALYYADRYIKEPWGKEALRQAAYKVAENDPRSALYYADRYVKEPWGKEVIKKAAEKHPVAALEHADRYVKEPWAYEVFSRILTSTPHIWQSKAMNVCINVVSQKGSAKDKKIIEILQKSNEQVNNNIPQLIELIVNRGVSYEDATKISGDPGRYTKTLEDLYYDRKPILGRKSIEGTLKEAYLRNVRLINNLHNAPDTKRFESAKEASSRTLYTMITMGEEEVFTSTFTGLFKILLEKLKAEKKSGYDMVKEVGFKNTRIFLKLCSRFNRLGDFFKTMSTSEKKDLLDRFIENIESQPDYLSEAVNIADFFGSLKDAAIQKYMQKLVKEQYERVKGKSERGERLYGLLAGMFAESAEMNKEWFEMIAEKYSMENVSHLRSAELYNRGINTQAHYFYGDKDGKASFSHFLGRYKRDKSWTIKDEDSYIILEKRKGAKKIVIYANKPDSESDEMNKAIKSRNLDSIVVVHRGHSYHASKTIDNIPNIAKIVSLGSCGGYANITAVLEKAPNAHIISTKGTGTMTVNDDLFKGLNENILTGQDIDWQKFWDSMGTKFRNNKMFNDYIPPHRNLGVMFLKAYRKLEKK